VILNVGELTDLGTGEDQYLDWIKQALTPGTEVAIRILESENVDEPVERRQQQPQEAVERAKAYYEDLKGLDS
jgi:hypothetical protein